MNSNYPSTPLFYEVFILATSLCLTLLMLWLDQEVDGETFLDLKEDDIKQLTKKLGLS